MYVCALARPHDVWFFISIHLFYQGPKTELEMLRVKNAKLRRQLSTIRTTCADQKESKTEQKNDPPVQGSSAASDVIAQEEQLSSVAAQDTGELQEQEQDITQQKDSQQQAVEAQSLIPMEAESTAETAADAAGATLTEEDKAILAAAYTATQCVYTQAIQSLKHMKRPPHLVKRLAHVVCSLLDEQPAKEYTSFLKLAQNTNGFFKRLRSLPDELKRRFQEGKSLKKAKTWEKAHKMLKDIDKAKMRR
jgi:hypothetical protein